MCAVDILRRHALNQSATYEVICRGIGGKGETASDAMKAQRECHAKMGSAR